MLAVVTSYDIEEIQEILPKLPSGPLNNYRSRATFDWRQMKVCLEGEEVIKYKNYIVDVLRKDPDFEHHPWELLPLEEERRLTVRRLKKLAKYNFVNENLVLLNPYLVPAYVMVIGSYSWSLMVKRTLSTEYFLMNLVTSKNNYEKGVRDDIANFRALGCISITELAHGSNAKELKTTATYDLNKQKFILNTPSLEATKCWSGVLGNSATHGIVFAQLHTPDGRCHGIHSFMIPLRDPRTLLTYPGVVISDMGPKIGLNGVDNGFAVFHNYEVNKETLMNRNATVSDQGEYVAKVKDENKRFGLQLGILSVGRVFINLMSLTNIQMAITIAVRYSSVRKQFAPNQQSTENQTNDSAPATHESTEEMKLRPKRESTLRQEGNNLETIRHYLNMDDENYEMKESASNEWNVIEYQSQQWRLAPYVAVYYVLHNFHFSFYRDYVDFFVTAYALSNDPEKEAAMGSEVHGLSSVAKASASWLARDCIQEAREACGGHGYLKASRLGELRNDNDANCTYEGDNNVLLQQTGNYLLRCFKEKLEQGKKMVSPFHTLNPLDDYEHILTAKYTDSTWLNLLTIQNTYNFLVCYLLKESYDKVQRELEEHNCPFMAKNLSQVYYIRSLALAYFEQNCLQRFINFLNEQEQDTPAEIVDVLQKLGQLYGLWSLEKHLPTLYDANYFNKYNGKPSMELRQSILLLCSQLKDNLVALVDAIAPHDFILNSSLGYSDGQIYHHIFDALTKSQGAFDRPSWYTEFTNEQTPKAKL